MEPRLFDPADVYQQIEVIQLRWGSFTVRLVAANGYRCHSTAFRMGPVTCV
jgi:hypothetical protein